MKIAAAQADVDRQRGRAQGQQPVEARRLRDEGAGARLGRLLRPRRGSASQQDFIVWQPARDHRLSALVASEPLRGLEGLAHLPPASTRCADVLPKAFDDLRFGFYGRTLTGTPQQRDRAKARARRHSTPRSATRSASSTSTKYFPASSKADVQDDGRRTSSPPSTGASTRSTGWRRRPRPKAQGQGRDHARRRRLSGPLARLFGARRSARDDAVGNLQRAQHARISPPARQARPAGRPRRMVDDAADRQRGQPAAAECAQLPGRDPGAAVLRSEGRRRRQLRRDRRGDRPRDQPQLRQSRRRRSMRTGKLRNWWTPADLAHFKAAGAGAGRAIRRL